MKKCRYCNFTLRPCGKAIRLKDDSGNDLLIKIAPADRERYVLITGKISSGNVPGKRFYEVGINYCPMCGRKLSEKDWE